MGINAVIDRIKAQNLLPTIKRYSYTPFNMGLALEYVTKLGQERNPRFTIDNNNRFVYENLIRWVQGDKEFKCIDPRTGKIIPGRLSAGIYLAGKVGSGKSWALEIMSAFTMIDNIQLCIGGQNRLLRWPSIRAEVICDEYVAAGQVGKYKNMSILCIQDLGSEPIESVHMGNRLNVLRQVLENRGDHTDQITLISSNYKLDGELLTTQYEDRVVSRLFEMCNYLELKGEDRRKI